MVTGHIDDGFEGPPVTSHLNAGDSYRLRDIPQLLACASHPNAVELERRHDAWLRRCYPFATPEAAERLMAQRNPLWTAACYPRADDDRYYDLDRVNSFLFAFDDLCQDYSDDGVSTAKQLMADCLSVMGGERAHTSIGAAWADIWASMGPQMPEHLRVRMVDTMADFGRGVLTEMSSRAAGTIMDFGTYRRVRLRQSLGAWMYYTFTEYAAGVALTRDTLDELEDLHWECAEHLLYSNDLFSFRAEHFHGEHINAVCVLTSDGASLQEAIDHITALVTDKEHQVARRLDTLRSSPLGSNPQVGVYLEHLEYEVSGNLHQSRYAPRYHGTEAYIGHPIQAGHITIWPDRTEYRDTPSSRVAS